MERFCIQNGTHIKGHQQLFLRCNNKCKYDGPSSKVMQRNQPRSVLRPGVKLRPPASLRLSRTMRTRWNAKATNGDGDVPSNYGNPLGDDDFLTYFADIKLSSWRPEFADQVTTLVREQVLMRMLHIVSPIVNFPQDLSS